MKLLRPLAIILTVVALLVMINRFSSGGVAPVPAIFHNNLTLDAAIERGRAEKRPVLVFATADWCGPCQVMKRTVLSEPSIEKQISRDFVTTYLDTDKNKELAAQFKIYSIPATIILWDGKLVAQVEGVIPHDSYEQWLAAAHAQALSDQPHLERASDEFLRNLNKSIEANASKNDPTPPAPQPSTLPPGHPPVPPR